MKNIALISAGRRVSLLKAFRKELSALMPGSKVFAIDLNPEISAACRIADAYFQLRQTTESGYIEELIDICLKNDIKLLIPTIDTELVNISANRERFLSNGIVPVISETGAIEIFNDKKRANSFFESLDINTAKIFAKDNYSLPLFLKPINGSNSQNNHVILEEEDFSRNHFRNEELLFFQYIDAKMHDEYTVDMYYDQNGILKCAVPRLRLKVRGGEVSKSLTCKNGLLMDLLSDKFGKITGVRACISAQLFMHKENNTIIASEINPRFGGGYPLSYLAGANYPKWIIEEYLLNKEINPYDDWKDNLLMLRYDDEILVNDFKS